MLEATVFDARPCFLGEGPLWHPRRGQLFWFDILAGRMLSQDGEGGPLEWSFGRCVSAAGWVDADRLVVASETGLDVFDLTTGRETPLARVEADDPATRSNDGRADPWGGFWMGTMSKTGVPGQGRLYRWFHGELHCLAEGLSTPNTICFDRDRACAYYSDTKTRQIMRQPLDPGTGWPVGTPGVFIDMRAKKTSPEFKPDGAVIDAEGCLWNAQWGAARVVRYSPDGVFLDVIDLPTGHTSCPAFGGPGLRHLFVTTAQEKLPPEPSNWQETAGLTFVCRAPVTGRPESAVRLMS